MEFVIWFGNIDLNRGLPKQINKLFSSIQSLIQKHEKQNLILIGDFNVNTNNISPKQKLLTNLCKKFQLNLQNPGKPSRDQGTLNFMISGQGIDITLQENLHTCSDHNILKWDIKFKATSKPKRFFITNKKAS